EVLNSASSQLPVTGTQLRDHLGGLHETGAALVFGLVLTFLGARGVAGAVQNALNTVWAVPFDQRPGFPWNQFRSIGMILGVGLGELITSLLSGLVVGIGQTWAQVGGVGVSLVLNIGLVWLGVRLG